MNPASDDPVIDELRRVRHDISARFDHDPEQLVAYYMQVQRQYESRLVSSPEKDDGADRSAA